MTSGAPPQNTGAERGEVTLTASIEIPLSLQDIVEVERLRTDVGIETDADYIVEALRMMRIAITLGRVGFVVQARSLTSQAVMDFAVPLDRHDGVRPIKPYGDMSDG